MHDRMIKLIDGAESEMLPRSGWRKVMQWAAGTRHGVKRKYRRRSRHTARLATRIAAQEAE